MTSPSAVIESHGETTHFTDIHGLNGYRSSITKAFENLGHLGGSREASKNTVQIMKGCDSNSYQDMRTYMSLTVSDFANGQRFITVQLTVFGNGVLFHKEPDTVGSFQQVLRLNLALRKR